MPTLEDVELGYVASIIKRPDQLDENIVHPKAIKGGMARAVYDAILKLHNAGRPIEYANIAGGAVTLSGLVSLVEGYATTNPAAIADFAKQLTLEYQITKLRELADYILHDAKPGTDPELAIEFIEHSLLEIAQGRHTETESLAQISNKFAAELLSEKEKWERGIETRIDALNKRITGFMPGEYVVVAAPPRYGKTAFAFDICYYNAMFGVNSLYIALDQSKRAMAQRLYTGLTGMDKYKLLHVDHRFNESEHGLIADAAKSVSQLKGQVFVNDNASLSITDIRSLARSYKRKYGIKILVLDYIQQIRSIGRSENRTQEMTDMSRKIKELARELEIPVIALSQLSRSYDGDCDPSKDRFPRPRLTMLRDSGAIEQDASLVLFLFNKAVLIQERFGDESVFYANELQKNQPGIIDAEVIIAKQKDGEQGTVQCKFNRQQTRFYSGEHSRPEPVDRSYLSGGGRV